MNALEFTSGADLMRHYAEVKSRFPKEPKLISLPRPLPMVRTLAQIPPWRPAWLILVFEVAAEYGLTRKDIMAKHRRGLIRKARCELIYRMKEDLHMSFPEIGHVLDLDHATAFYAYHQHAKLIGAE